MEAIIKKLLFKLYPEMQQGQHLLQFAVITDLQPDISSGQVSSAMEPRYAVNIQMIDKAGNLYGPIIESVPLPVAMASHNRGAFGFPQVGTRVAIQYAYGDPEQPVIVNIYPHDKNLPALKGSETLLQHSPATFLRSSDEENWELRARNKIRVGNADVDLVDQVQQLAAILASHTHPRVGVISQSADVTTIANNVNKIKV